VRPPRPDILQALANALAASGMVVTARHGVVRIAPHLQVGVEDMRRVAATIGDVARMRVSRHR